MGKQGDSSHRVATRVEAETKKSIRRNFEFRSTLNMRCQVAAFILLMVFCGGDARNIQAKRSKASRRQSDALDDYAAIIRDAKYIQAKRLKASRRQSDALDDYVAIIRDLQKGMKRLLEIADIPVRLVGGSKPTEGRVEVFRRGEWGTVCDDGFDDNDAKVVCRSLGFAYGTSHQGRGSHSFGQGSGKIWMDDFDCSGNEMNLAQCGFSWHHYENSTGSHDCTHVEDVGVTCHPSY